MPTLSDSLYENERYRVVLGEFPQAIELHGGQYERGYIIINKETEVEEVYTAQYPDAIAAAEQLDISVEAKVWKWIRINHDADIVDAEEKAGIEPEVH